jgi:hypothetical protein
MKEVPNVISVKDLLYIEDMLNWNLIMNKKIYSLGDYIEDKEITTLLNKARKMHAKHFEELLTIME